MPTPEVTILVPNFRTPKITRLCLRLLRKHTDPDRIHVIAIDNDSGAYDESVQYLRSLDWIELIERPSVEGESPGASHAAALDMALERVNTPYVMSIHTDTFVLRDDWLDFLLDQIKSDENVAGVGSWKLEVKPWYKLMLKKIEYALQLLIYPLIGKEVIKAGKGRHFYYLRSHLALYRTELLKKYGLSFGAGEETAGKFLHKALVEKGHEMVFLPSEKLIRYAVHLNHATMILNPELGSREKTVRKGARRIHAMLRKMNAEQTLQDSSLDQ
ncbi:MAG: glycosyltransferase [Gammaproteobacteria bacterium]|nr:MAG: glycosyltransferase [Gammaproteobacteria bacterium]